VTDEPPIDSRWVELYLATVYLAAVAVVDEWDDGDSVDPDRMDVAIARLREVIERGR
jgi:hypothetical protein